MTFSNFLELIDNLNQDLHFYVRINNQNYPLSKITAGHDEFLAIPGQRSMTKKQIVQLFGKMHQRGITLWIKQKSDRIPVYGVQISIDNGTATLM